MSYIYSYFDIWVYHTTQSNPGTSGPVQDVILKWASDPNEEVLEYREELQGALTSANISSIGTEVAFHELKPTRADTINAAGMRRTREVGGNRTTAAITTRKPIKQQDLNVSKKKNPNDALTPCLPESLGNKLSDASKGFMESHHATFPSHNSGVNEGQFSAAFQEKVVPILKTISGVEKLNMIRCAASSKAENRVLYVSTLPRAIEEASNNYERGEQPRLSDSDQEAFVECLDEICHLKEVLLNPCLESDPLTLDTIPFLELEDHIETFGVGLLQRGTPTENFGDLSEAPLLYKGSKKLIAVSKEDNTRAFMFW